MTILVEEEKPAEPMDMSEEAFRHEMEMKRQEEAIGGVYGSPYWVKQLVSGLSQLQPAPADRRPAGDDCRETPELERG